MVLKKNAKVSVIMSNYNGKTLGLIPQNLEKILKNTYPNLEVIFVDNASTDDSLSAVRKKFPKNPKLKIIKNPVNMYSQGLNLGIKASTGEYVAFFNNDAYVTNDYFKKFIPFLEKNPDVGLAQAKLLSGRDTTKIDSVGETMDNFGNPVTIGSGEKDSKRKYNKVMDVLSVSGSCSILRKALVKKIGYFDEDYGIGYEDLDLALRVRGQGNKVVYFPGVTVYHKRGSTDLSPMVKILCRWHFNKNRIMTMMKNYPWSFLIVNLPGTVFIYLFAGFWEIVLKGQFTLGAKRFTSLGWVIGHMPLILEKRKKSRSLIAKSEMDTMLKLMPKQRTRSLMIFLHTK